jgi:hypothetical protein
VQRERIQQANKGLFDRQTIAMIVALVLLGGALGTTWLAVSWGSKIDSANPDLTTDPFGPFFGVLPGSVVCPESATWIPVATADILIVLALVVGVAISRARRVKATSTARPRTWGRAATSARCQPPAPSAPRSASASRTGSECPSESSLPVASSYMAPRKI